jgi:hypothetical protein
MAKGGRLFEMNKPLWELASFECRYPVSTLEIAEDDDRPARSVEIFCADPVAAGSAYCREHAELCSGPGMSRLTL